MTRLVSKTFSLTKKTLSFVGYIEAGLGELLSVLFLLTFSKYVEFKLLYQGQVYLTADAIIILILCLMIISLLAWISEQKKAGNRKIMDNHLFSRRTFYFRLIFSVIFITLLYYVFLNPEVEAILISGFILSIYWFGVTSTVITAQNSQARFTKRDRV